MSEYKIDDSVGFDIDPKYKPKVVEEIENHRVQLEPMTYASALHLAYLEVVKGNLDEEIKEQVIAHLSKLFLRVII